MSNEIISHKFRELLLPSLLIAMALNIASVVDASFVATFIGSNAQAALQVLERSTEDNQTSRPQLGRTAQMDAQAWPRSLFPEAVPGLQSGTNAPEEAKAGRQITT